MVSDQSRATAGTIELTHQLGEQLSKLVREEIALAKAEAFASGRQAVLGGGLLSGAAVAGHTAWLAMAGAAVAGIAVVLPVWAAALIVGGALAAIAGVLAVLGRGRLRRAVPLRMTTDSVRKELSGLAASGSAAVNGRGR
jgi:Putative Actinobacterial Holin-X, holin superfamily III